MSEKEKVVGPAAGMSRLERAVNSLGLQADGIYDQVDELAERLKILLADSVGKEEPLETTSESVFEEPRCILIARMEDVYFKLHAIREILNRLLNQLVL